MIDPETIVDAVVGALRGIPDLAQALNGDAERIRGFHDLAGVDVPLRKAVYEMSAPGILIAYAGTLPQSTQWGEGVFKHRVYCCMVLGNQAQSDAPIGYGTFWKKIIGSGPVKGWDQVAGANIRSVQLVEGLEIMDTPGVLRQMDEDGIDYFEGVFAFPEIGDN